MSHPPPSRRRAFTIVELIATLVIFGIIMTIVIGQVQLIQKARRNNLQTSRSMLVIDNTLEYVRATAPVPQAEVQARFAREFELMQIPSKHALQPRARWSDSGLELAILRRSNGQPLVRVEVPR